MKKPIYILIKKGIYYRTIDRGSFFEDVDLIGNTIGIEILNYETFEVDGKNALKIRGKKNEQNSKLS